MGSQFGVRRMDGIAGWCSQDVIGGCVLSTGDEVVSKERSGCRRLFVRMDHR